MKNSRNTKLGLAIVASGLIGAVLIMQSDFGPPEAPGTGSASQGLSAQSPTSPEGNLAGGVGSHDTGTERAAQRKVSDSRPEPPYTFATTADYEAVSAYGALPTHLRDIRLRELRYDSEGNLVVDVSIKSLIESLLSAAQIEGRDQAVARIREYMTMSLPEPAASQALAILESYLDYKTALAEIHLPRQGNLDRGTLISQFEQAMEARKQLRREHLPGGVADALFPYEAYDDFSLQRMAIRTNPDLSNAQKQELIIQQEKLLPEDIRQRVSEDRLRKDVETTIADLKAAGGYEREIYELRRDFYGQEVADRLAYFEDNSSDWQQRVALFNQERAQIQQRNLSPSEKEALIAELRQSTFSEKEQVKLAVQNIRNRATQAN